MKRCVFVFNLFLILVLISFASAADFNLNDKTTWASGSDEELKTLTSNDLFNLGDDVVIEELWERFNENTKNGFLELELKKKYGQLFDVKGLGNINLKLEGDVLSDKNGAKFSLKNPPEGLISLSYDSKQGFIYEFENGKAVLQKGTLKTVDGKLVFDEVGDNIDMNGFNWNGEGDVQINQGFFWLENNAEVSKDGIIYKQVGEEVGLVQPTQPRRAKLVNSQAQSADGVIKDVYIKGKSTLAVFDDNPTESKRYARIGSKNVEIVGKNIDVEILKDFENVKLDGSNLNLKNGVFNYKVDENGDLKIPRKMLGGASNSIFKIENLQDSGNLYRHKSDSDGSFFEDFDRYSIVGRGIEKYNFDERGIISEDTSEIKIYADYEQYKKFIESEDYKAGKYKTSKEFVKAMSDSISNKGFEAVFLRNVGKESFLREMEKRESSVSERAKPDIMRNSAIAAAGYLFERSRELESQGNQRRPVRNFLGLAREWVEFGSEGVKLKPPQEFNSVTSVLEDSKSIQAAVESYDKYSVGSVMRYETNPSDSQGIFQIIPMTEDSKTLITQPDTTRYVVEDTWENNPRFFKEIWKEYAERHGY